MKKGLIILSFVLLGAVIYGIYLWNKPAKSAATEEVFASIQAPALYEEFKNNPEESAKKYLNKNLEISGSVESVAQDSSGSKCVLTTGSDDMGVISISFLKATENIQIGQSVKIRGLCAGYLADDLLGGNVQLNQAVLVQ
ncbi:MAG: hypothetical protein RLY35_303 [Bacteroidota bacterium]|jgi:hypothetical protein